LTAYSAAPEQVAEGGVVPFATAVMRTLSSVYGIRMAGVFMISLGTIWLRTGNMPRLLALLTYGLALLLLFGLGLSPWAVLIFPAWVLGISAYILVLSLRASEPRPSPAPEG
jgi:hypothetical protein